MPELPNWFPSFLTWFLGAGGPIVGLYLWYLQRKKLPIDTSTAQIANAVAISNVAKGVVDMLGEQIDDFKGHIDKQDKKIDDQNIEISLLKTRVVNIENVWISWYADLSNRWSVHRLLDKAPDAPDWRFNDKSN